jgi:hypothetical protein
LPGFKTGFSTTEGAGTKLPTTQDLRGQGEVIRQQ